MYVLLADDDTTIIEILQSFFPRKHFGYLQSTQSGREVIDYLSHLVPQKDELPALVLLDMRMENERSGIRVLKMIRNNPELEHIPVVIISSSDYKDDITEAYRNGANSYFVKADDLDDFLDAMDRLLDYWSDVVSLPNKN